MEIWEAIRENIIEILVGLGAIGTYLATRKKESKLEQLERKRQKAHQNSLKAEENRRKAYQKEAKYDEEVKKYASSK